MAEYVYIWEYEVRPEHVDAFERHYGPDGTWVQLFRRAQGHRETRLLRERSTPGRFVTVDRWESAAAFEQFRRDFSREFDELDRACEALTEHENEIGTFDVAGAS